MLNFESVATDQAAVFEALGLITSWDFNIAKVRFPVKLKLHTS